MTCEHTFTRLNYNDLTDGWVVECVDCGMFLTSNEEETTEMVEPVVHDHADDEYRASKGN